MFRIGSGWFDQFVLSNQGKAVLEVGTINGETQVKLNGKVVSSGKVRSLPQQFPQSSSMLPSTCVHRCVLPLSSALR